MKRGAIDMQRAAADLTFVNQVQQILPDLFRTQSLGRGVEVLGEALDGLHISVNG